MMKNLRISALVMLVMSLVAASCNTINNTEKGYVAGTVGGTVIGAASQRAAIESEASSISVTEPEQVSYYDDATGLYYTKMNRDDAILFDSRSCELNGYACKEILRIAAELRNIPFAGIMIYGSTDDAESRDYSVELSQERAEVVRDYFTALGFNANLLNVVALGSRYPVADNSTLEGRAKNRCVEVYIVNEKQ